MNREFTVLLKQPESPPDSTGKKIWKVVNEFIKSPIFVFMFGASVGTIYPAIREMLTPSEQLEQMKAQEQARADAALIAPFLAHLSSTEPGKFQASRAALHALEEASTAQGNGKKRVVFTAVNQAIDAVAMEIWPPTSKTLITEAETARIEAVAQLAATPPTDLTAAYEKLRSTLVYIQADKNAAEQLAKANEIRKTLRANLIIAPGVEKIDTKKIPQKNQVRYFNDSDKEKAELLAAVAGSVAKSQVYTVKVNLPDQKIKEGTLELWLGKGA